MRKIFCLPLLIFVFGCKQEVKESYFTAGKASVYFREIEDICQRDSGLLWGRNLYGPVMLVERSTRRIFANQPDKEGLLKEKDGIYTGLYPNELVILNAPAVYGGTLYAMVPVPSEEDEHRIPSWTLHVLYHCFQNTNGARHVIFNQRNLDDEKARLWIKLEWKALRKAILSQGQEKMTAIRDALVFRCTNREFFNEYSEETYRFEIYEGLATFTDFKLCSDSPEEFRTNLITFLDWIYSMPSYSSVYGNISGALYASLLYDAGYDLRAVGNSTADLGEIVRQVYKTELPEICRDVAGSLALCYDLPMITNEEQKRLASIQQRLHKLTSVFTEKSVVYLELEDPSFDFEPEDIQPVDTLGILYNSMRVSDNWGKLAVDKGGCLVSGNFRFLRITARGFRTEKNRISGEGWNLILNDGWELVEVNENYFLRNITAI